MNPDTGQMARVHGMLEEMFGGDEQKKVEEIQKKILASCHDEVEEFASWHEAREAGFEALTDAEASEMAPLSRQERRARLKLWRSSSKKAKR